MATDGPDRMSTNEHADALLAAALGSGASYARAMRPLPYPKDLGRQPG